MAVTGIVGKKIGMTQVFDEKGDVHPITVLQAGPCVITQLKTLARDGYEAAQIGLVEFVKTKNVTKPQAGHFAKTEAPPVKVIKEVDLEVDAEGVVATKAGDRVLVDIFSGCEVCGRDRHLEGPRLCGSGAPARVRRRTQVARAHVPGAGLDRRVQLSVAGVSRGSACRATWATDQVTVRNLRIRGIDRRREFADGRGSRAGITVKVMC